MTKWAVVTGGSSGIGLEIIRRLLADKWKVIEMSRRHPELQNKDLVFIPTDFYKNEEIRESCHKAINISDGDIKVVIHCVGDILIESQIKYFPEETLYKTFQVNFFSAFLLTKYLFKIIAKNKGIFLYLSSVAKDKVYPNISDYCAAKAALSNFVKSVALELAPYGARAVSISPAVVDTPLFRKSKYTVEEASKWHKLGRIGKPEDIANLVSFLISEKANWITGVDYLIEGGFLL